MIVLPPLTLAVVNLEVKGWFGEVNNLQAIFQRACFPLLSGFHPNPPDLKN
jgi:hypothetical protein